MRVPPFFLGCAVLFWAWHAQVLLLGVAMAVALEAPRVARTRWALGPAEFARIADLCTWGFVILAGYLTFTKGMPLPILQIFEWLPVVMLPLVVAQRFSAAGRLPLSSIFMMLRGAGRAPHDDSSIDLSYPYAVACALSAGAANVRHDGYYYGLLLLLAWALWHVRSRHYRWYVWTPLLAGAAALGYAGHLGLSRLQEIVLESAASSGGARTDPYKSTTDIGEIGELKQSDRIVLRVAAPQNMAAPLLLHRASYNAYVAPAWLAHGAPFAALGAEPERSSWVLDDEGNAAIAADARGAASSVVISQPAERGKTVLALPNGAARIERLPVPGMQRNELGAVQVESPDDLLTYRVLYAAGAGPRDAPRETDLRVPRQEAAALHAIAERLELRGKPAREVLAIVRNYFAAEFTYSTYLSTPASQATPLADFLLVTRAGHCEYFATATALLLRVAGLPARYATGYSVREWSDLEASYIARARHAHSWVRVRVDGRWVDFDTTPPVWFAVEAQNASSIQPLADLWSWAAYRYERWLKEEPAARTIVALALIAPLAAVLIWRLLRQPLAAARARRSFAGAAPIWPGRDSEFYQIEARLIRAGCDRAPNEPLGAWLERVGRERADIAVAPLHDLLRLHYRYRFDPVGLDASERRALGAQAQRWLQAHAGLR